MIEHRGDRWRIRWLDELGRRRSQTFASEAAARKALRRRQVESDEVRAGVARPRSHLTLAQAAADWLEARPPKRRRDDEGRLRVHVLPFLGETMLAKITPALLERFVRHLEAKNVARPGQKTPAKLKPQTVKNVLALLSKLMGDMGFQVRIKYKVPTAGYGWIKEPSDVGRFLAACRPPWFRIAAALAVYAGLRRGEVAGLRRDALDFERGLIRLDRSFDGPVKSKRVRWVPLGPELASILRPWLLEHPGPMVVTRNDAPLDEKPDLAQFTRRACRRAGVDPVNFHQLRHSFASHLAQRVPLSIVGAVLGHADPRTTARYAHLDPESLARDPKLHLSFAAPAGEVIPFEPGATAARPKAK